MLWFVFLNIGFTILMGCGLVFLFKYRPHFLIKPSVVYLTVNYIFIQIPAAAYSFVAYQITDSIVEFFILSQVLPLFLLLLLGGYEFSSASRDIWERICDNSFSIDKRILKSYCLLISLIVLIYLYYVGIKQTGIYAILFVPEESTWARELSLKLLDSSWIKYSYSLMCSAMVPILAAMGALQIRFLLEKKRNVLETVPWLLLVSACFISISFPGHRWGPMVVVLSMVTAVLCANCFKNLSLKLVLKSASILLLIMCSISIMREGVDLAGTDLVSYFWEIDNDSIVDSPGLFWGIVHRVFFLPMKAAFDYVNYVESASFWGIAAIPKIASVFDVEPIAVSNVMYLKCYPQSSITSGTYPTGFLYSYYSYFGFSSIIIDVICLFVADYLLHLCRLLSNSLLIPVLSTMLVSIFNLVGADFTTTLITHGMGSCILIALVVQYLAKSFPKCKEK